MTPDLPGTALPADLTDTPTSQGGPHPAYQALLAQDVLGFQACGACGRAVFSPRERCSHCGADALSWRASAGRGSIYSTSVITPRDKPAYAVVLVDLDEGYRMMSRIVDAEAASVRIDDRVEVRFVAAGDEVLPMFTPDGGPR